LDLVVFIPELIPEQLNDRGNVIAQPLPMTPKQHRPVRRQLAQL